ncbi:MAG: hypothetical protein LUF85_16100 [Bacteroides sp.]|nr:hypothetical protein [Bacteroides sp.]
MENNTSKHSLFIFNPEHDLALANGDPHYMPSAAVRQMIADLALLPCWYAPAGSRIIAPSAYNLAFLEEMRMLFPDLPDVCTPPEVATGSWSAIQPWGWDAVVTKQLLLLGADPELLPDPERLRLLRELSHRLQAVRLLARLTEEESPLCGESSFLTEEQQLREYVEGRSAVVLKAPLSGSGKGLNWCKGVFTPHIRRWCARVIRQQGGVVAEPVYQKETDFAMGFYSNGKGQVAFCSYSLFHTNASGAYEGNELLSNAAIEQRLIRYIPSEVLRNVRQSLERELSLLYGTLYTGYLGVDMMICCFSTAPVYRLHPCIEINLRMNMGLVARLLYDKYVDPRSTGMFRIDYYPSASEANETHEKMLRQYPAVVADGRVVSGYVPLVPVTPHSQYRAWITVQPT